MTSSAPAGDPRIQKLLEDIRQVNIAHHDLLQAVRGLILGMDPGISEEVKYGGILFSSGTPFCGLFAYTHHVSLEFGDGAALADTFHMLEGAGKQRRHIKLAHQEEVPSKHVLHYLRLAFKASQKV